MRWKTRFPVWRGVASPPSNKLLLLLVQGLACTVLAWMVAQGFWWLVATESAGRAPKPSPLLSQQSQLVAARHLFGVAPPAPPPSSRMAGASASSQTPTTNWRLIGTYVLPGAHSRAVLATDSSPEVAIARVGDVLSTGQELAEIRPDGIVLSQGTQRIELVLRPPAPPGQGYEPTGSDIRPVGAPPLTKDSR